MFDYIIVGAGSASGVLVKRLSVNPANSVRSLEAGPSDNSTPSRRVINGLGFAACIFMLGYAYCLQYNRGLQPCPLCIVQRLILAILGIIFLAAAIHNPRRRGARRYGALLVLTAGTGAVTAGYQVWLQSLPQDTAPFCLPPLDYLLGSFPLTDAITMILKSPGECSEIQWTFAGLSIPAWTCVAFAGLGATGIIHNRNTFPLKGVRGPK